jgi:hypothetical protein
VAKDPGAAVCIVDLGAHWCHHAAAAKPLLLRALDTLRGVAQAVTHSAPGRLGCLIPFEGGRGKPAYMQRARYLGIHWLQLLPEHICRRTSTGGVTSTFVMHSSRALYGIHACDGHRVAVTDVVIHCIELDVGHPLARVTLRKGISNNEYTTTSTS